MTEAQTAPARASSILTGKRALIMGVADKHSLAWGIAQQLYAHGAKLAFTYIEEPKGRLERNVRELAATLEGEFPMFACDVTDDAALESTFSGISDAWGGLDIVAHCVAYADRDDLNKPFSHVSRSGYKMAMEISAYSLNSVCKHASPLMTNGGSIMTLTYNAVERAVPGYSAMAAAKAALEVGVRYLAVELGPQKIRVNAISAGPVRTLSASAVKGISLLRAWTEQASPLRENITLEDVGNAAVFLASDLSRMITGNILFVDSGTHVLAGQVAAIPPGTVG